MSPNVIELPNGRPPRPLLQVKYLPAKLLGLQAAQTGRATSRGPTSILGPHPYIRSGRVLDRRKLAVAGLARRHLATAVARDPLFPRRPPRNRAAGRAGGPFLGAGWDGVALPLPVFA